MTSTPSGAHADVDVLISNAALHWVPKHLQLLRQWADALPSGAWVASQVPGNFQAPSHRLLLDPGESRAFEKQYAELLREAYPPPSGGTLYPFRRIFAVGRKF